MYGNSYHTKESNQMNTKLNAKLWIGAASLLLIQTLQPISAEAHHFSCQASALRLNLLNAVVVDPVVANPADDPCATDSRSLLSVNNLLGNLSADAVSAKTVSNPNPGPVWAAASVVKLKLDVLGLANVKVGALWSAAIAKPVGGACVLSGSSSIADATILGQRIGVPVPEVRFKEIPILGLLGKKVATLYLNATIRHTDKLIQRALWLHIDSPLGPLGLLKELADVVVGEAIVDLEQGNPCGGP